MNIHNICYHEEIRKYQQLLVEKKMPCLELYVPTQSEQGFLLPVELQDTVDMLIYGNGTGQIV